MAVLLKHHAPKVPALLRQMALYFLSFDILLSAANVNTYCQLAQLVEDQTLDRTLFSTLNYDCLLEIAFSSRQLSFNYFDDPEGVAPIWKLHGSCNFRTASADKSHDVGSGRTPLPGLIEHMQIADARELWLWESTDVFPPAMSIYLRDTYNQPAHPQLIELLQRWGNIVRSAQNVVVVGAQPYPKEDRIWGPLSDTPARVTYVGDPGAFNRWVANNRTGGQSEFAGSTFDQGFEMVVDALLQ